MSAYRWVCLVGEVRGGRHYQAGEVFDGTGPSPMGSPSWTPIPMGADLPPAPPPPEPVPEVPKEPQPAVDWSSDEAATKSRADLAAWRARGGGQ
jgi:hypothetical protein